MNESKREVPESSRENKESGLEEKQAERDHFASTYELKRKTEYETEHGYQYKTDRLGRISECQGALVLDPETKANKAAQRSVGGEDRHTGEKTVDGKVEYDKDDKDDGGHLIARVFGGSPEADNLVAMNYHVNRGEYKNIENRWKSTLQEKDENGNQKYDVEVKIRVRYDGDSKRPKEFIIQSVNRDRATGEVCGTMNRRIKNEGTTTE